MYHVLQGFMFDAIQSGGPGAKPSGRHGGMGAARPPNGGDGRGRRDSQWILGDGIISGDGQGLI